MITPGYRLILLLSATGGPALPDGPFRLSVSYQACMETPYQRSIRLVILARIYLALRTPNIFVRMTWKKTRSLSEFQPLPKYPCHSAARISGKRCPTAPEGVAYQMANCAAGRRQ